MKKWVTLLDIWDMCVKTTVRYTPSFAKIESQYHSLIEVNWILIPASQSVALCLLG